MLQNIGLIPDLTVAENIALPLQARRLPKRLIAERTDGALAAVGLSSLASRFAAQLSGGQQQRVGVARALAGNVDVLIADEPTSELDAENRALVLRLLRDEVVRKKIVVVASHDADVVAACDSELALQGGRAGDSANEPVSTH